MSRRAAILIAFYGLLLVVLGMLVGIPFTDAITSGGSPELQRAWRVAHTSLVTSGLLYMAIAAIAHLAIVGPRTAAFVTRSLVLSAYIIAFAFTVGPAVGARGLEPTGPALHILVFVTLAAALLATFLAVLVLLWGLFEALRREPA